MTPAEMWLRNTNVSTNVGAFTPSNIVEMTVPVIIGGGLGYVVGGKIGMILGGIIGGFIPVKLSK